MKIDNLVARGCSHAFFNSPHTCPICEGSFINMETVGAIGETCVTSFRCGDCHSEWEVSGKSIDMSIAGICGHAN